MFDTIGVNLSAELTKAIEELAPLEHELDRDGSFDAVSFLNNKFGDSVTLDTVLGYSRSVRDEIAQLDIVLKESFAAHVSRAASAPQQMLELRSSVKDAKSQLLRVQKEALVCEEQLDELYKALSPLETAKRNIDLNITTFKKIVMLVNACDHIVDLASHREYRQVAALVLSVRELEHTSFQGLRHIGRIDEVLCRLERVLRDLHNQLIDEFLETPHSIDSPVSVDYVGASEVVDALGGDTRREIMNRFCIRTMKEYVEQFSPPGGKFNGLIHFQKRFDWLAEALKKFTASQKEGSVVFPAQWMVNGELCMYFCHETRQHFVQLLDGAENSDNSDVSLLITVHKRCLELESELEKRFNRLAKNFSTGSNFFKFKSIMSDYFIPFIRKKGSAY